jgi:hypothetical protein
LLLMPVDRRVAENFGRQVIDPIGVQIYLPETPGSDIAYLDAPPGEL